MKKIKYLLFTLLLIPISVNAATINCSAPGSVVSGDTFNVTFSGNLSSPASIWFGKIGNGGNATYVSGGLSIDGEEGASFSRTVTFKAGDPGSANFYIYDMDASDGNETYTDSGSCTVTIVAASSSNSSSGGGGGGYTYVERSSNNNLSSITIDGVTLTPEFNKDNLEYKAVVEGKVEKINVNAELEDGSAYVDGLGERDLIEGVNRIELKVTAENGDEKVYVIEITRKEKDPIEVIINKKKYTVLTILLSFRFSTRSIQEPGTQTDTLKYPVPFPLPCPPVWRILFDIAKPWSHGLTATALSWERDTETSGSFRSAGN